MMSNEPEFLIKLGSYISKKANEKFRSNVEFANVCDINESSIRRILQGKQNISLSILIRICDALDMKTSDVIKAIGY